DARPETIFSFFTDPQKTVKSKGIDAKLDPRPGGCYRVNINGNDVAVGKYVEIVPFTKIIFTWGWEAHGHPMPPGSSVVEITLTPDGASTVVRLRHSGIPSKELRDLHAMGWDHYSSRLAMAATGKNPGPNQTITQDMKHN
ncbi:MAG: SRPBCC domain-containing protein, partial [Dehalococcoidia bacterium]|nr:SRPBCC domain-containing protein [Dehalococcoidia bacterium]